MDTNIDQAALGAATKIMDLLPADEHRGGAIQKKARIHVIIADLLRQFQPGGQQGPVPRVGGNEVPAPTFNPDDPSSTVWDAMFVPAASRAVLPVTDEQIIEACQGIYLSDFQGVQGSRAYDLAIARAVLALACPVAGWVPDGWQLVPKEPTAAMNQAGEYAASMEWALRKSFRWVGKNAYRKMLEAAPPAPVVTPTQQEQQ